MNHLKSLSRFFLISKPFHRQRDLNQDAEGVLVRKMKLCAIIHLKLAS